MDDAERVFHKKQLLLIELVGCVCNRVIHGKPGQVGASGQRKFPPALMGLCVSVKRS